MAYENLCMYCFEDLGGADVCPHCGRDSRAAVPQIQLLPGTMLYHNRFLVGRAMGQDATGIVYMAYDTKREAKLRIREYLPRESAKRLNDGSVVPVPGAEDAFEQGIQKLRASVERVEDPKKRHFFFEENGTAYIAQRKSASHAQEISDGGDETRRTTRQLAILIGAAAVVVLAALINGAKCLGLELPQVQTVISGAGAAGISICKLLMKAGVRDITLCDRQGAIWEGREGLNGAKTAMAKVTNRAMRKGSLAEVMEGADLFIGVSGPGIVTQEMVRSMSPQAMVFALSNPVPEIMPELALAAGAKVVATGRSDFPNQINNLLVFPGIFKGALAARASRITEEMMIAAAYAIAGRVSPEELSRECIIPSTFDMGVADVVAEAVKAHVEH